MPDLLRKTELLALALALALPATAAAQVTRPPAPTSFIVGIGSSSARLSWIPPAGATSFEYSTDAGTSWLPIPGSNANTEEFTIRGLTNGTEYRFSVRGRNSAGAGAAAIIVRATPQVDPPLAPTGLSATGGDGEVTLNWTPAGGATSYEYHVGGGNTNWQAVAGSTGTTNTYTVQHLTNGTTYTFRIRGKNSGGAGPASNSQTATPRDPPGAPTGLTATAGNASVTLNWTAGTNSSRISSYDYQQDSGSWTAISGSSRSTTSTVVRGLTNGRRYTFKVRGRNHDVPSPASNTASATPSAADDPQEDAPALAAPTGLTAAPGEKKVTLAWTKPSGTITGYDYSQDGTWSSMTGSSSTTTGYEVSGLENNTEYTFRVRAKNGSQTGAASAEVKATPGRPEKPGGLTATGSGTSVTLNWTTPKGAVTGYDVRRWEAGKDREDSRWGTGWQDISGSSKTTTSHAVSGLTRGKRYMFQVRADSIAGVGAESDEAGATIPPAAPTSLTATAGNAKATLSWTAPAGIITGYDYQQNGGTWRAINGSTSSSTSGVVGSLTNGTQYNFQVRARNSGGAGPASNQAAATPAAPATAPAAPTNLTATAGDTQVTLAWTAPSGSITGYDYSQDNGSTWTAMTGSNASTTSRVVTNLTNGTTYTFRVRAKNSVGAGAASNSASARPEAAVRAPGAPTGLTAEPGDARVTLAWTQPSGPISNYEYSRNNGGTWAGIPGSDATTISYIVTSLINGTGYTFRVRAVNSAGKGAASGPASATPIGVRVERGTDDSELNNGDNPPGAPSGLSTTPGDGEIGLFWTPPSGQVTGYDYSIDGCSTWTAMTDAGAGTTGFVVTGLTNGTTYNMCVRARNDAGAGPAAGPVAATPRAGAGAACNNAQTQRRSFNCDRQEQRAQVPVPSLPAAASGLLGALLSAAGARAVRWRRPRPGPSA